MIVQDAPRREARLVLGRQRVLIELRRRRLFRGQEVERQERRPGRGERRGGGHLLAGQRADDEVGPLLGHEGPGSAHAWTPGAVKSRTPPPAWRGRGIR